MNGLVAGILLSFCLSSPSFGDPFVTLESSSASPEEANLLILGGAHGQGPNAWAELDAKTVAKVRQIRNGRPVLIMHESLGEYEYDKVFLKGMGFDREERRQIEILGIDNYTLVEFSHSLNLKRQFTDLHYSGKIRSFFMAQVIVRARSKYPNHLIVIEGGASHVIDGVIATVLKENGIRGAFMYDSERVTREEIEEISKPFHWRSLAEARIASRVIDLKIKQRAEQLKANYSSPLHMSKDAQTYLDSCEACRCFLTASWSEYAATLLRQ